MRELKLSCEVEQPCFEEVHMHCDQLARQFPFMHVAALVAFVRDESR